MPSTAFPAVWAKYCGFFAHTWLRDKEPGMLTARDRMYEAFITFVLVPFAILHGLEVPSELIQSVVAFNIFAELGRIPMIIQAPRDPSVNFSTWCDYVVAKINDISISYRASMSLDFFDSEICEMIAVFAKKKNLCVGDTMDRLLGGDGDNSDCDSSTESVNSC
jgi:hypothetical protein